MAVTRRIALLSTLAAAFLAACKRKPPAAIADTIPPYPSKPTHEGPASEATIAWAINQLPPNFRQLFVSMDVKFTSGKVVYRQKGDDMPYRETANILLEGLDYKAEKWKVRLYGRLSRDNEDREGKAKFGFTVSAPKKQNSYGEALVGTPDINLVGHLAFEKASAVIAKAREEAKLDPTPVNSARRIGAARTAVLAA